MKRATVAEIVAAAVVDGPGAVPSVVRSGLVVRNKKPRRTKTHARKTTGPLLENPSPKRYRLVLKKGAQRQTVEFNSRDDNTARRYVSSGLLRAKYRGWAPISLKRTRARARAKNPTARAEAAAAARALEDFTGNSRVKLVRGKAPKAAKAGWVLGTVKKISYLATRDGEPYELTHTFKRRSRPQLVSTADGSQLYLLGGAYSITERGIVDR